MVTRGQFLERPTLIPVGRVVLEGLAHRGVRSPPVLIIPPRPQDGSGMDHVLAAELAWAVATAGHPTLRFNFRGVGASQGQRGVGLSLVKDAAAALTLAEENAAASSAVVVSVGSGARVARELLEIRRSIERVCFVAPSGLCPEDFPGLRVPFCVVVAEHDRSLPRESIFEAGGTLEVMEGADAAFLRHLPQVGRAVARWLRPEATG